MEGVNIIYLIRFNAFGKSSYTFHEKKKETEKKARGNLFLV
jgi:hypothetical protein